ncbi:MAG: N-6 DNA methylase [Paludibacteraceae bacterium]|nr:N-6 DNA methylase [Paludibacteraceae bacterium]
MFFQNTIIKTYTALLNEEQVTTSWNTYKAYFLNPAIQDNIRASKEEQFQEGFLRELFVKVFGYTLNPTPDYNLITEQKNETDAKKADGAILRDGKVIGVIELKDHKTTDLSHVERQAFGYKSQHKDTRYVVISNFEKLRFYIDNAVEHIEWNLFTLTEEEFKQLYFCLSWGTLSQDLPLKAKTESVSSEDQITQQLYKDYSAFKREIFTDIVANNTDQNTPKEQILLLFKKTQKLLDRLLFIFFAEDCGLLPPNSMIMILDQWEQLKEMDEYVPLYARIKKYFGYMDTGYQGKKYEIFAYNGGLFKPDEVLDGLKINDELLAKFTRKLSEYDYASEVDVNILGHIFENSLSEIEEVTAQINAGEKATSVSKRKRDGVFYTPQYITKYIVENTVGRLCAEKKAEMDIDEAEYFADKNRQTATKKRLLENLTKYREWLLGITICDPACGSGAFLNAALRFLMDEHKLLDEMEAKITGSAIEFPGVENSILENNLYGVDINEESVEIAKLALWLRTAKPHRKLNSLNNNIKCGNSLISDPAIAGDKAFNWQNEFPQVFAKGGFDVVIGNPPYVQAVDSEKDYYKQNYPAVEGHIDLFEIFIQKGMNILKDRGQFAFINPNTVLSNLYSQKLRRKMVYEYGLREVLNFGMDVFEDPTVHTCIILMNKGLSFSEIQVKQKIKSAEDIEKPFDYAVPVKDIEENSNFSFDLTLNAAERALFRRLQHLSTLGDMCYLRQCIKTGNDPEYVTQTNEELPEPWKKTLRGKGMARYIIKEENVYLKYGNWLARNWNNKSFYECNKIAVRETGDRINACLDTENRYFLSSIYAVYPKQAYDISTLKKMLAILNSRFATFFVQKIAFDLTEGAFTKIRTNQLARLPLPNLDDAQNLVELADAMLSINKDLQAKRARFLRRLQDNMPEVKINGALEEFDKLDFAGFVAELKKQKIKLSLVQQDEWEEYFNLYKAACNELSAKIAATDKEIDSRVYALYGLTDEEIKIIEG